MATSPPVGPAIWRTTPSSVKPPPFPPPATRVEDVLAERGDGALLVGDELPDAVAGQVEQIVELSPAQRLLFGRRLELYEPPVLDHDHVHVRLGEEILGVAEVEAGVA